MRAFTAIAILLLLFLTAGCIQNQEPVQTGTAVLSFKYTDRDGQTIVERELEVEKGANAFEAVKQEIEVEAEEYVFGAFVKGLAGVLTPRGYYLALYVNGEYATKGISDYTIEKDTSIEWKTELLESFIGPFN